MVLCGSSALVLLMAEGGIPHLRRGMGLLFSHSSGSCAGKRNPLRQLVTAPAPIAGGTGNPSAGSSSAEPSQLLTGILHAAPLSSIPPPSPPEQSSELPLSSVLLSPPAQPPLSPEFLLPRSRCSAAFCAQNNFCSGNSSPSLSSLLQYFSLAFALGDVVEH